MAAVGGLPEVRGTQGVSTWPPLDQGKADTSQLLPAAVRTEKSHTPVAVGKPPLVGRAAWET